MSSKKKLKVCAVRGCGRSSESSPSALFFPFPQMYQQTFDAWFSFSNPEAAQPWWVCARHFDPAQYESPVKLLRNARPTLFPGLPKPPEEVPTGKLKRKNKQLSLVPENGPNKFRTQSGDSGVAQFTPLKSPSQNLDMGYVAKNQDGGRAQTTGKIGPTPSKVQRLTHSTIDPPDIGGCFSGWSESLNHDTPMGAAFKEVLEDLRSSKSSAPLTKQNAPHNPQERLSQFFPPTDHRQNVSQSSLKSTTVTLKPSSKKIDLNIDKSSFQNTQKLKPKIISAKPVTIQEIRTIKKRKPREYRPQKSLLSETFPKILFGTPKSLSDTTNPPEHPENSTDSRDVVNDDGKPRTLVKVDPKFVPEHIKKLLEASKSSMAKKPESVPNAQPVVNGDTGEVQVRAELVKTLVKVDPKTVPEYVKQFLAASKKEGLAKGDVKAKVSDKSTPDKTVYNSGTVELGVGTSLEPKAAVQSIEGDTSEIILKHKGIKPKNDAICHEPGKLKLPEIRKTRGKSKIVIEQAKKIQNRVETSSQTSWPIPGGAVASLAEAESDDDVVFLGESIVNLPSSESESELNAAWNTRNFQPILGCASAQPDPNQDDIDNYMAFLKSMKIPTVCRGSSADDSRDVAGRAPENIAQNGRPYTFTLKNLRLANKRTSTVKNPPLRKTKPNILRRTLHPERPTPENPSQEDTAHDVIFVNSVDRPAEQTPVTMFDPTTHTALELIFDPVTGKLSQFEPDELGNPKRILKTTNQSVILLHQAFEKLNETFERGMASSDHDYTRQNEFKLPTDDPIAIFREAYMAYRDEHLQKIDIFYKPVGFNSFMHLLLMEDDVKLHPILKEIAAAYISPKSPVKLPQSKQSKRIPLLLKRSVACEKLKEHHNYVLLALNPKNASPSNIVINALQMDDITSGRMKPGLVPAADVLKHNTIREHFVLDKNKSLGHCEPARKPKAVPTKNVPFPRLRDSFSVDALKEDNILKKVLKDSLSLPKGAVVPVDVPLDHMTSCYVKLVDVLQQKGILKKYLPANGVANAPRRTNRTKKSTKGTKLK